MRKETIHPSVKPKATGHGERILIVDDNPWLLKTAAALLNRKGYEVLLATNGCEALTQMQESERISVVLTDIMMPVMDGVALIRELVQVHPTVKIIAATGLPDPALTEELSILGVSDVLLKPYASAKLLTTLHDVIHDEDPCNNLCAAGVC